MNGNQTGSILIKLVDGKREPLPSSVSWSARIQDGRSLNARKTMEFEGSGSAELIKGLTFFDNFFDDYTIVVNAKGYDDAGWTPICISPQRPAPANLMLVEKGAHLNFGGAQWNTLDSIRPRFAQIIATSVDNAADRYAILMETNNGLVLACLLNLLTAMSQITLPSGKTPLDYYWQPIWGDTQFAMAQDRFFAYVDTALVDDVVAAGKVGAFAEEKDPGTFHPGATLSYKQTQFDVTNVQLTFHQGNAKTIQGINCIVVEPDIDYYKDLVSHALLEVVPNKFTGGLTDPRTVYFLRWIAARQAGADFNPLYTITT